MTANVPILQGTSRFFSQSPLLPFLSTSLRLGHVIQPLSSNHPARIESRGQEGRRRNGKRLPPHLEVDRDRPMTQHWVGRVNYG